MAADECLGSSHLMADVRIAKANVLAIYLYATSVRGRLQTPASRAPKRSFANCSKLVHALRFDSLTLHEFPAKSEFMIRIKTSNYFLVSQVSLSWPIRRGM
jgi:hypothetical protein